MTRAAEWDEGAPMTTLGLLSATSFLLACGVEPEDLGPAWSYMRSLQHNADYPSQMAPLVEEMQMFAAERAVERQRHAAGLAGRHTQPIRLA